MKILDRVRKTIKSVDLDVKDLYEERPNEYVLVTAHIGGSARHAEKLYSLGLIMTDVHDSETKKGFIDVHLSEKEEAKPLYDFQSYKFGPHVICADCKRPIRLRIIADKYETYNIEDGSKHDC